MEEQRALPAEDKRDAVISGVGDQLIAALAGSDLVKVAKCKGDLLELPMNPELERWAWTMLSHDMELLFKEKVVARMRNLLADIATNPQLRTGSRLPKVRVSSALARTRWTGVDVFRSVAASMQRSPSQLWNDVPEAVRGIIEPPWPCDELGWQAITDPVTLPPFAESLCSSAQLSFANEHLAAFCEYIGLSVNLVTERNELRRARVRFALGTIATAVVCERLEIRRISRW
jgi:hypothetical protein